MNTIETLENWVRRIDADGTPSQIVSADEVRELIAAFRAQAGAGEAVERDNAMFGRGALDDARGAAEAMCAFGASDAACYLYPGEDEAPLRAAYIRGAADDHPSPAVPVQREGWKLVPVEPTEEMIERGLEQWSNLHDIYEAMIAASPSPTKED